MKTRSVALMQIFLIALRITAAVHSIGADKLMITVVKARDVNRSMVSVMMRVDQHL